MAEAKAKGIRTLDDLNRYWRYYLDEYYLKKPHDGIREYYECLGRAVPDGGISPEQEWGRDTRQLTFLDAGVVGEAFMHHEKRVVNKGGCISFKGRQYEVSAAFIGAEIEIAYDPAADTAITVYCPGTAPVQAEPLKIGSFCDRKPEIPASMLPEKPGTSRLLDVLEGKHRESRERMADAIAYGSYRKDGGGHV